MGDALKTGVAVRGEHLEAQKMKRQLDVSTKLDELDKQDVARQPEPSPKYSKKWWDWYATEYTFWKREIKVKMASTAEELTKNGVYQKRTSDLKRTLGGYTNAQIISNLHNTKEVGLCLMEVWHGPLPPSDLDFAKEDAQSMFSGASPCIYV
jgi:hypothetical protein